MLARVLAGSALFAGLCAAGSVHAQEAGDADKGLSYAGQACAHCHAVRKGDAFSPHPRAPSFEAIANTAGVTGISLAAALRSSHENMPGFVLSVAEKDNVIAYILSLKRE